MLPNLVVTGTIRHLLTVLLTPLKFLQSLSQSSEQDFDVEGKYIEKEWVQEDKRGWWKPKQ